MKLSVFKNSQIAIMVPAALNADSNFENPLVLDGFRSFVTILGAFNYFETLEIFIWLFGNNYMEYQACSF